MIVLMSMRAGGNFFYGAIWLVGKNLQIFPAMIPYHYRTNINAPPTMSSSKRLKEAAEQLIKAAYLDVKAEGESKASEATVAAIATGNDYLAALDKQVASLKETMDAKINTLNQNVGNVKEQLEVLQRSTETQTKLLNICWAIENCKLNSFQYYEGRNDRETSENLVRNILFSFRQGFGYFLPADDAMKET